MNWNVGGISAMMFEDYGQNIMKGNIFGVLRHVVFPLSLSILHRSTLMRYLISWRTVHIYTSVDSRVG